MEQEHEAAIKWTSQDHCVKASSLTRLQTLILSPTSSCKLLQKPVNCVIGENTLMHILCLNTTRNARAWLTKSFEIHYCKYYG